MDPNSPLYIPELAASGESAKFLKTRNKLPAMTPCSPVALSIPSSPVPQLMTSPILPIKTNTRRQAMDIRNLCRSPSLPPPMPPTAAHDMQAAPNPFTPHLQMPKPVPHPVYRSQMLVHSGTPVFPLRYMEQVVDPITTRATSMSISPGSTVWPITPCGTPPNATYLYSPTFTPDIALIPRKRADYI